MKTQTERMKTKKKLFVLKQNKGVSSEHHHYNILATRKKKENKRRIIYASAQLKPKPLDFLFSRFHCRSTTLVNRTCHSHCASHHFRQFIFVRF